MKNLLFSFIALTLLFSDVAGQKLPTGDPKDFKVKTCLHSVSYMGIWRGQAVLTVDQFLVKAAFDCWSPTLEGLSSEEIKKAIYTMKPYIVHTTTADYEKLPRYKYEANHTNYVATIPQMRAVPMGEGFLDYKTFINTLKEIGYQGYIAYEMCEVLKGGGSVENLDKSAKSFLEYVKQFR